MIKAMMDVDNLDDMIRYWRKEKKNATTDEERLVASCYIDAYQTVRVNNNLGLLQKEKN